MFDLVPCFRILALNAMLSLMVGFLAWRRRKCPGGASLTWLMGAVAFWQVVAAFEAASVPRSMKLFWSSWEYVGSGAAGVFLVLFARHYAGGSKDFSRRQLYLLWALPAAGFLMAATNSWHGLVWTAVTPGPPQSNQVIYHHGPLVWVVTLWFYAYLGWAVWILLHASRPAGHLSRRQIQPVLLALVCPWIASVVYLLDLNPVAGLNLVPASFLPTAFLLLYALIQEGLLDLVPVARDRVVESMCEGVVATTADGVVVDLNPAAASLLRVSADACVGRPLSECIPQLTAWADADSEQREPGTAQVQDGSVTLSITHSIIRGHNGSAMGHVLLLSDVTRQRQIEAEREELIQELQTSLADVNALTGLLPICSGCKKMRDDSGYWHSVEAYLSRHSDAQLSHALCPDCIRFYYPDDADAILAKQAGSTQVTA